MADKSVWLVNKRGCPVAYRTPAGEIVYVANAAVLQLWHKRRERAKAREEQSGG